MSELESRRRHPSNYSPLDLHEHMSDRLHILHREFDELSEVAGRTKGVTGWMFRRAVRKMMGQINAMEIEMEAGRNVVPIATNISEKCSHGDYLQSCAMPLCLEIKTGRHYRAQKQARKAARKGKLEGAWID